MSTAIKLSRKALYKYKLIKRYIYKRPLYHKDVNNIKPNRINRNVYVSSKLHKADLILRHEKINAVMVLANARITDVNPKGKGIR